MRYVLRPVLGDACRAAASTATASAAAADACVFHGTGGPLQLPAFGVEMAIKNLEFSALYDSKVHM